MDKLICGCGGEARLWEVKRRSLGGIVEWHITCLCGIETDYYDTKEEAITVFKKATRHGLVRRVEQLEGALSGIKEGLQKAQNIYGKHHFKETIALIDQALRPESEEKPE